ncbi:MAG: lipopolysaccharide biosynthesis protein [Atopobiaceae bacterium]|nr:lipopolysaccharide biosynthesis protein [Atopobiaceae bacterium]
MQVSDDNNLVEERYRRSAYVWNTAGSMLNAFQSVVMLMVLTRVCDLATAGIFTIAYANANLFLTMGNYGMRNFEASDVKPEFSFGAYWRSRVVTDVAMLVCSTAYLCWSAATVGYSTEKFVAIALMAVFKLVDSVEDVFDGNYQQHGRLDVGGKLLTLRTGSALVVFGVCAVVLKSLVPALTIATAFTGAFLVAGLVAIRRRHAMPAADASASSHSPWLLLRNCFPLFLASFLLFYVGNAPKYAIDALMSDAAQAQYGFIAMPVFVVGLLAQFIYMPMIEPLSRMWNDGDAPGFRHAFVKQILLVLGITAVCVAGAWLLGVPVLGWLYNTDLSPFQVELCVLVAGGGFLALASLFTMGITIMRKQRLLVWGYVVVAVAAWALSTPLVSAWGIAGASWAYIACMAVLALWFGGLFVLESRG